MEKELKSCARGSNEAKEVREGRGGGEERARDDND